MLAVSISAFASLLSLCRHHHFIKETQSKPRRESEAARVNRVGHIHAWKFLCLMSLTAAKLCLILAIIFSVFFFLLPHFSFIPNARAPADSQSLDTGPI